MFKIYADGTLLYEPLNDELVITAPKLSLEMGKAGSLQFTIPPTNRRFADLHQLKTRVSVEWDSVEIFRGRVLDMTRAFNNTRVVYCEGDLSYLLDTVQRGERYTGKAHDLFKKIIANHNARIKDTAKQFTVGELTVENRDVVIVGESDEIKDLETGKFDYRQIAINAMSSEWDNTMSYIEKCITEYTGGYLRTRRDGDTVYIDLLKEYDTSSGERIAVEFGKNLLDLSEEIFTDDVFTVLIPLGDNGLTISSVNSGSDELVDTAGVERFGRIVKTVSFGGVTSAATLLENARRYLANHENLPVVLTVKAVDMHFVDDKVQPIYIGDKIKVLSTPHGMKDVLTCTQIEYDLQDPSKNVYTFGTPKQTLTQRYKKDMEAQKEEAKDAAQDAIAGGGTGSDESFGGGGGSIADILEDQTNDLADIVDDNYAEFEDKTQELEQKDEEINNTVTKNHNEYVENKQKTDETLQLHSQTLTEHGDHIDNAEADIGVLTDAQHAQVEMNARFNDNIAAVKATADENSSKIEAQAKTLDDHKASLTLLSDATQSLAEMDAKFGDNLGKITIRVTDAESKITSHTETLTGLSGAMSKAQTNIEQLTTKQQAMIELEAEYGDRIGKVEITASANESAIKLKADTTYVDGKVLDINTKVTDISSDVVNIGKKANGNAESITTLNSNVTKITGRLETAEANIGTLNSNWASIDELIAKKINADYFKGVGISVQALTASMGIIARGSIYADDKIYMGGNLVATQEWVTSQLANYSKNSHKHDFSFTAEYGHDHGFTAYGDGKSHTTGMVNKWYSNKTTGTTGPAK